MATDIEEVYKMFPCAKAQAEENMEFWGGEESLNESNMPKYLDTALKVHGGEEDLYQFFQQIINHDHFLMKENLIRYEAQKGVPVIDFYENVNIKSLFKKFKIIDIQQRFIFPYKIKPYKKNQYIKLNHFKHMDKKIFNILEKNLGEHLLITLKK